MQTILLIDDDDGLRSMLAELFTQEGYRVLAAADGEQGLRLGRAHHPDIILSDVRMPGTNGHEALIEFRRTPGFDAIPVILMTGDADLPDMRKSMELGADDYLPKPIDLANLLRIVRQHLDRTAQRRAAASAELLALRRNLGAMLPPDLVDPLHEIIGCASVLEVDANLMPPDDVRDFARNIIAGAETLNRRLENFILYSALEAGNLTGSLSPHVEVHDLVQHTAEQVARRHHRSEHLRFQLTPLTTSVSRDLLAKIVGELVDNACRYSIKSEPIDVELTVSADTFTVVVADHGMGIPPEKLARLDQSNDGATSFGLNLARRVTETLDGTWHLANQPKRGVRITLTFAISR